MQRNRPRRIVDIDRHAGQWCISRPLDNGGVVGGIKFRAVTWADQMRSGRIELHRAASVRTGRIIADKIPIIQVNQYAGITIGWDGEGHGAVGGYGAFLRDGVR